MRTRLQQVLSLGPPPAGKLENHGQPGHCVSTGLVFLGCWFANFVKGAKGYVT